MELPGVAPEGSARADRPALPAAHADTVRAGQLRVPGSGPGSAPFPRHGGGGPPVPGEVGEALDPAPGRREAVSSNTIRASVPEVAVEARVGDHIVVHSTHQGEVERTGEVLEVRGE